MKDENSEEVDASNSSFSSSFFDSQLRTDESWESNLEVIQIKLSICDLLLRIVSNRMTQWTPPPMDRLVVQCWIVKNVAKFHIG